MKVENFRLLRNCTLDMRDKTTLLVGKNNTGKTSFAVILEKFLTRSSGFSFTDFPTCMRAEILNISDATNINTTSIRLIVRIKYSEEDDLSVLSEFMLDLDSTRRHVNILFEASIDKESLLRSLPSELKERTRFIKDNLGRNFIDVKCYAFDDTGHTGKAPYYVEHRDQLEEKESKELAPLLNFQVIHARRNVASSEDGGHGANPLSAISTKYFRKVEKDSSIIDADETGPVETTEKKTFDQLRAHLAELDEQLAEQYGNVFGTFLKSSSNFLDLQELKVVSNIQSQTLIENSSQVIYGDSDNYLPENYNGLGYLNILFLLLQIELCRDEFSRKKAPINLLIIEEPEAHTHPQMQYVFADKIRGLISEISDLQAVITTHSSHIISKSDFEDIRYLSKDPKTNGVKLKNFHTDLRLEYEAMEDSGPALFKFLKQYLTINSAELFFASKAIFIEGTTESILLPWFIQQFDKEFDGNLSSQNITVLEVGANAKAFAPFLNFIGVKTLIITDIDTTEYTVSADTKKSAYRACRVNGSTHTSNETLKHFFGSPEDVTSDAYISWQQQLLDGTLTTGTDHLKIAYQLEQNGYHARSFEDAFLSINSDKIVENLDNLQGIKNKSKLVDEPLDYYKLTEEILAKKSDFAASVLYSALANDEAWEIPNYIKGGLEWIQQN